MKLALALFICAGAIFGQDVQISGLIQDPSSLSVAGAEISVRNEQTGGRRITQSNETGFYSVPSLNPGIYRISIRARGFETVIHEGVKLEVGENVRLDFALRIGDSRTVVTVKSGPPLMNTEDASIGTVIGRDFIDQLPLNGRGIQTLVELTPGVVVVPVTQTSAGQWSVNGQRSDANYLTVDGVSVDFAAGTLSSSYLNAFNSLGQAGGGSLPANNLLGTFSSLVSPDALREFQIQTSTFAPEFGRAPAAQIGLVTRSGTNRYSGALFEYIRNDATDANDWFSDQLGIAKQPLRFNNFGASLGGPVQVPSLYNGHDRTFLFLSFDDLVMRQPQPPITLLVPTSQTRAAASPLAAALFDTAPLPNRAVSNLGQIAPGWGEFVGANFLDHDQRTYGLRLDQYFSDKLSGFVRYNQAPSNLVERSFPDVGYQTDTERYTLQTQMLTVGLTEANGPNVVNEVRLNGSRQLQDVSFGLNGFGAAQQPSAALLFPAGYSAKDTLVSVMDATYPLSIPNFMIGNFSHTDARQLQAVDRFSYSSGSHQLKFGADYRWFSPLITAPRLELLYSFYDLGTGVASVLSIDRTNEVGYVASALSAYAQDTWQISRNLTTTFGVRWELDPAPNADNGPSSWLQQLTSLSDFSHLTPLAPGKSLYPTQYLNFAPRLGLAWLLSDRRRGKTVLRAGAGLFYDLAQSGFENSLARPISSSNYDHVPFGSNPTDGPEIVYTSYVAAAPQYRLPQVYQWNLTIEHSFGQQTFSAGYVGALGRHLVGTTALNLSNASYDLKPLGAVSVLASEFSSSYNALQMQFNRRLVHGVQALVSYTWSHSIDNLSADEGTTPGGYGSFDNSLQVFRDPDMNRGPSDFDIRQSLNGAVVLSLPSPRHGLGAPLLRGWTANGIFFARSAPPSDLYVLSSRNNLYVRPDVVPGQPLYLYGKGYPGGKSYNPNAFIAPAILDSEGNLGRNVLRGFGAWQIDFALHREFRLSEQTGLQFRVEAFNVLNHPMFANPAAYANEPSREILGTPNFGLSSATLASALGPSGTQGELNPLFQIGGPRTMQLRSALTSNIEELSRQIPQLLSYKTGLLPHTKLQHLPLCNQERRDLKQLEASLKIVAFRC